MRVLRLGDSRDSKIIKDFTGEYTEASQEYRTVLHNKIYMKSLSPSVPCPRTDINKRGVIL